MSPVGSTPATCWPAQSSTNSQAAARKLARRFSTHPRRLSTHPRPNQLALPLENPCLALGTKVAAFPLMSRTVAIFTLVLFVLGLHLVEKIARRERNAARVRP